MEKQVTVLTNPKAEAYLPPKMKVFTVAVRKSILDNSPGGDDGGGAGGDSGGTDGWD